jgi:parvulin-like peptidyl-prolyl isomerase
MKRAASVLAFALAACAAHAQTQSPVADATPVIESGGLALTKFEFEQLIATEPRYQGAAAVSEGRRSLAANFGKALGLEAEARRRKLEEDPKIALKIRHATHQILAYELISQLRRDYLADQAKLEAEYERSKTAYEQPRVRLIYVRTAGASAAAPAGRKELSVDEAGARAATLRARLAAGADFAALAKGESDDLGSRDRGGDIGFVVRGTTAGAFETAAYSLPVNQLSEVIQTQDGFYLIRVEDRQPMTLGRVKEIIANDLAHKEAERLMAGYKLNEAYFGAK